jgi:hypothetical protein
MSRIIRVTLLAAAFVCGFASSSMAIEASLKSDRCTNTKCDGPMACIWGGQMNCSLASPTGPCTISWCEPT